MSNPRIVSAESFVAAYYQHGNRDNIDGTVGVCVVQGLLVGGGTVLPLLLI